ncbi:MAG TPA: GNAT family N-acetyltransferase [Rhodocyclaceae bacterium]|jgi:acetyltransferase|nr:GNAT family N-acetyltransferase [Rhodocyclaceae bacterium]HNM22987.1 GNAT family N-acetyltransferase [Rhodocyclaceae bacterium]HNP04122.1 GNAT family N-acetyltransferase [Rhodocyclaceae bacterium]
MNRSLLAGLVSPTAVALFGANPDDHSLGGALTRNLLEGGYAGEVYLINPKHREIRGRACHPSLDAIDARIDLALIVTPADGVAGIVEQCGKKRIRHAVVHSAGFAEAGEFGALVQTNLMETARRCGVRIMGPRALGFIRPSLGLNATLFYRRIPAGNLAFVSQSAGVCLNVLDWAFSNDFALSAVFGPGAGGDVDLPEILDFLATDAKTEAILLYLEGIRSSRRFLSALRAAARSKPVVAVKAGRTALTAALAHTHSQATGGVDASFDAALRRAGALRVPTVGDLFTAARALASPRRPAGNRLAIVANGGGPALLAADAAVQQGLQLARFIPATKAKLAMGLPISWSQGNPVDVLIDASAERFATAIGLCLADPGVDGVLVVVAPNGLSDPVDTARRILDVQREAGKPILVSLMGESSVAESRALLTRAGVPAFRTPESAVAAYAFMAEFVRNQELLLETPASISHRKAPAAPAAKVVIDFAIQAGRETLTEGEVRRIAEAFHLPLLPADSPADPTARQLVVRLESDPLWGPVLSLDDGSPLSRSLASRALPPLNERLARELLTAPGVSPLTGDPEGSSARTRQLTDILLRISEMACELPALRNLELPVRLGETAALCGLSIRLRPWSGESWRYGHMAICPYPLSLEKVAHGKDRKEFRLRPIRPEDADAFQEFVRGLSERSRYTRFFGSLRELSREQLVRHTQIDYDREMVLVATERDEHAVESIIGEASYTVLPDSHGCEFGVVVADRVAGRGIATQLMGSLLDAARQRGLRTMVGEVLKDNGPMKGLVSSLGFAVAQADDPDILKVTRKLNDR